MIIEDSPSLDKTPTADSTASVQGGVTEDELKKEEESSATSELLEPAVIPHNPGGSARRIVVPEYTRHQDYAKLGR